MPPHPPTNTPTHEPAARTHQHPNPLREPTNHQSPITNHQSPIIIIEDGTNHRKEER